MLELEPEPKILDTWSQWRTQKISEGGQVSSQSYNITNQL